MNFTREFVNDLHQVLAAAEVGERFAFARFNTGECPMVRGLPAAGRGSGWKADPERNPAYYQALKAAWECTDPRWYVGISCPCCNPPEHRWYMGNLHVPKERATFATLFMGSNWPKTRQWLLENRKSYILVAPRKSDFEVPGNAFEPNWDWTQLRTNLSQIDGKTPIVFAAGPLGKILCRELLPTTHGPLIDIGSALDLEMFERPTRLYHHRPLRQKLKKKKDVKQNKVRKALWLRTCKWKLAEKPVHKG